MKYLLWMLAFFLIAWAMCQDARGHEDHLEYITDYIVQDTFDGKQFRTVDDVCWEIYKSPHGDITSRTTLHIRRVKCNGNNEM